MLLRQDKGADGANAKRSINIRKVFSERCLAFANLWRAYNVNSEGREIRSSSRKDIDMRCVRAVAGLAVLALFAGMVFNQETRTDKPAKDKTDKSSKDKTDKSAKDKTDKPAKDKTDKPSDDKPATHKIVKKPFKIERTVKGILAPEETAEISYRPHLMVHQPESHGPLTIRTIVEHGTRVKKGDLLVAFDTTTITEVSDKLDTEKKGLQASIKLAEEELPLTLKSVPIELAAAKYAKKHADEELKYFLDVDKEQTEKRANMFLKSAKFFVEYAEEELKQLEKMYKSNDLTEETERMILRRQQHWVEQSKFWYQAAVVERDHLIKHVLPHREKTLKENKERQELQFEKAHKTLALSASQKQIA